MSPREGVIIAKAQTKKRALDVDWTKVCGYVFSGVVDRRSSAL